jgi:hypothetical protein
MWKYRYRCREEIRGDDRDPSLGLRERQTRRKPATQSYEATVRAVAGHASRAAEQVKEGYMRKTSSRTTWVVWAFLAVCVVGCAGPGMTDPIVGAGIGQNALATTASSQQSTAGGHGHR